MEFKEFKTLLQEHFARMTRDSDRLFEVSCDRDELWNLYLDSFPDGTNNIFRERREYDCSCCRHFIKNIGAAVVIKDNVMHTIWEFKTGDSTYQPVIDALDAFVKSKPIDSVYATKQADIGTDKNHEEYEGHVLTWEHFFLRLPQKFVNRSSKSEGEIKGDARATKGVFERSLEEISEDALLTVLELIAQKSLYRGEEWKAVLEKFLAYKREYMTLTTEQRALYVWEQSVDAGASVSRIRNHSIGVLLTDIADGMDLDAAVRRYEKIVAPANYRRPKAIFTKKMLEDAKKTITDLGYMDSLSRRFATLDDITVNNILFSNRDAAKRINEADDIFGDMEREVSTDPKKFSRVQEIQVEDFLRDVLPTVQSVEAFLENKHASNMVSLIAPVNPEAKTMFKWANGFSWAYTGNVTDSSLKENVKTAGGKVDGVLRFSIQWNDGTEHDRNDLDAHCIEPYGYEIYFGRKLDCATGGNLDIDIQVPTNGMPAVENITWPEKSRMIPGVYRFFVNNYANRGGRGGFRAEIEFDGAIYSFDYPKEVRHKENVDVAKVTLDKDGTFTIKELLPSSVSGQDIWGLHTNQFVPVYVIMNSPNYWDEQQGIGHKHYFFMLTGCKNPEKPNGFYNEFLKQDLIQHKRVFEALGGKMAVKDTEDQLSGIGFSSTKRGELVVKVKGATERVLKIKF